MNKWIVPGIGGLLYRDGPSISKSSTTVSTVRSPQRPRIPGFDSELTLKRSGSIPFLNWNRTSVRVRRARRRCWWPKRRTNTRIATRSSLWCWLWHQPHCQCRCCYWKWRSTNIILICLNHWLTVVFMLSSYVCQPTQLSLRIKPEPYFRTSLKLCYIKHRIFLHVENQFYVLSEIISLQFITFKQLLAVGCSFDLGLFIKSTIRIIKTKSVIAVNVPHLIISSFVVGPHCLLFKYLLKLTLSV